MRPRRDHRGFVAVEFVLATGLLLLPVVMLVAALPQWSERQHAAIVAARDAVRVAARDWPADGGADAVRVARETVAHYGVAADDVGVVVSGGAARGDLVTVTVTIRMPAIAVPLLARSASWSWTARESLRIDDYRSR